MLRHGARVFLAGAAVCVAAVFSGPASLAQQADPQVQLDSINAQKDLWQQRLDQAKGQISRSGQSLAAAKSRLDKTKSSLTLAKAQAAVLQANNPDQIDQLKQDLAGTQSELDSILKDSADRQNTLISDLGANQQLIDETNGQLEATAQQIEYTGRRLADLQAAIGRIRQDQADTQKQLDVFLRATYKEQQRSLLEFLLDSVSFGDFLTHVTNLQSVAQQQDHLLSLLSTQQRQLEEVQAEQRAQLQNLRDLQDAETTEKQTLQLQRQNFDQLLEQARVEAQEANDRLSSREVQVQFAIDHKQGELSDNQRLLRELRDAQNQLSSTITNQADMLTKAQQQEKAARTQLDQLEREAEGVAAIINQAKPTKTYSSGALAWPMRGAMEQGFGPSPYWFEPSITFQGVRYKHFHTGIDIATASGTPIRAAADGQVIATGYSSWGYGNNAIISHNPQLATLYAHMSRLAVAKGAVVKQGQIIGYEGSTGNSTGPHLHFEVRVNGDFVNPLSYL